MAANGRFRARYVARPSASRKVQAKPPASGADGLSPAKHECQVDKLGPARGLHAGRVTSTGLRPAQPGLAESPVVANAKMTGRRNSGAARSRPTCVDRAAPSVAASGTPGGKSGVESHAVPSNHTMPLGFGP